MCVCVCVRMHALITSTQNSGQVLLCVQGFLYACLHVLSALPYKECTYRQLYTCTSGLHTEGGGWNSPPPRNLEIAYGYYCGAINISYLILHVTGRNKYVSSKCCLESLSQIVSEAI